ncbi:MAG: MOSC N-terminal beta barrel domain-containing protein [Pseudomonadota bacterium]
MHLSELALHPLKSARRVRVPELVLGPLGPEWDRRWMLVDASGRFVTQRSHPRLCLLSALVERGRLRLAADGWSDHRVVPDACPASLAVTVWGDTVLAQAPSAAADAWCSDFLGLPLRLVFLPESVVRPVDPAWAGAGHRTAFSDGFPLLLVTQPSLDHLNGRLREAGVPAVDWARFRPNLVVAGDLPPHAEDGWRRLRVGGVELALVKPCSRCVIPAIDPATADKDSRILTILRRYRTREDGRIYFGQNVVVAHAPQGARLRCGEKVEILG